MAIRLCRRRGGAKAIAKAPVHAYRWTLKPLIGWACTLSACSEYALEAIERKTGVARELAGRCRACSELLIPGARTTSTPYPAYQYPSPADALAVWTLAAAAALA